MLFVTRRWANALLWVVFAVVVIGGDGLYHWGPRPGYDACIVED